MGYSFKRYKRYLITNAFQKILTQSNRRTNKICINKDSEFKKRKMKSWL